MLSLDGGPSLGPPLSGSRPNSRELVGFGGCAVRARIDQGVGSSPSEELAQPLQGCHGASKSLGAQMSFRLRAIVPSWDWAAKTMASVSKIAAPMLLAGKSVKTPSLRSFHALVMSPKGEILGIPTLPLV